jgi:hypothetical protein
LGEGACSHVPGGYSSVAAMFWGGGAPSIEGGMVVGRGRASLQSGLMQSRRCRCKDAGEGDMHLYSLVCCNLGVIDARMQEKGAGAGFTR